MKLYSAFMKDESGVLAQEALNVVYAAMVIGVGGIVFYNFIANSPTLGGNLPVATTNQYNTTIANIVTNTSTSMTLLTIGLLVAGAVAILVVVLSKLGRLGGAGGGGGA